jgi:AcrR family transcriptional regulator
MTSKAPLRSRKNDAEPGTRDRILDAAERQFSLHSYENCTLRNISNTHDINLGLIHYYFGGKERLFSEVFIRRSEALITRRMTLLSEAIERMGGEPVPVNEIIRCIILPTVEMIREGEGPRAYIRIQGLLRSETSSFAKKLRAEAFGVTNRTFIQELQRSCPHLSPPSIIWRFSAMIGAFYALVSQPSRVIELSDGHVDPDDIDTAFAEAIQFISGGFAATSSGSGDGGESSKKPAGRRKKVAKRTR